MAPTSGGIIREIGWKCEAVGLCPSVCPSTRPAKLLLPTLLRDLPFCVPRVAGDAPGGAVALPPGAGGHRWPGVNALQSQLMM